MTDSKALANALGAYRSKYDLVGPTVDDDIARAIDRYGPKAVGDAVKRQTANKNRRPKIIISDVLLPVIEKDAVRWLKGISKYKSCSDGTIVKKLAGRGTERAIQARLAKERETSTAMHTFGITHERWPVADHLRATRWLGAVSPLWAGVCNERIAELEKQLAIHEAQIGPVPETMDRQQLFAAIYDLELKTKYTAMAKAQQVSTPQTAFSRILGAGSRSGDVEE